MTHRGPDDEGTFADGPLGFGFRRLSILDISPAGHQPMSSADGRHTIVFNGEVYNFLELREELMAGGETFRTDGDTEVILAAYRRWGAGCFERFNGMWGLCIWDRDTGTLVASRDRFGIKPLYLGRRADRWLLGSELAALRTLDPQPPRIHRARAVDYLDMGLLDHTDDSALAGWKRLRPGHVLTLKPGDQQGREEAFYRLEDAGDSERRARVLADPDGAEGRRLIEEFHDAFLDSVRLRLRADVPVGTCLSGGLDSTGIVAASARVAGEARSGNARHAFSAITPEFDESRWIQAIVDATGVSLTRAVLDDTTLAHAVEGMLTRQDEPVHSLTPLAGYQVFKAANEAGVTVLLNGQGADELLAGYESYVAGFIVSILSEHGALAAMKQWRREGVNLRDARAVLRSLAGPIGDAVASRLRARGLVSGGLVDAGVRADVLDQTWLARADVPRSLEPALIDSVTNFPLPLYLRIEDRNAMAWSREARLPFLDPKLVALARTAPAILKRRDGYNKWMQREAFRNLLPEVVRSRREKMGFPVPAGRWLRGPLRDLLLDTLSPDRLRQRGLYDVPRLIATRDAFLASDSLLAPADMYRAFLFEAWARRHVDRPV